MIGLAPGERPAAGPFALKRDDDLFRCLAHRGIPGRRSIIMIGCDPHYMRPLGTVAPIGNEPVAGGLVSVITPVFGAGQRYLPDAYSSLTAQRLPSGWSWEWLVQEDGETGEVVARAPADDRVRAGQGRHGGPGTARTLALARSRGRLIKVLDADDQLTPGALARDIDAFTNHPDIGWTTSQALDLHADGSTTRFLTNVGAGRLRRTDIFDRWVDHDFDLPVHPATLCIRRQVIMALGGWMALPASEDTGLLIAASIASDGYFIDEPGLLYRKWAGQSTSQPAHVDPSERTARMWIILERALALLG